MTPTRAVIAIIFILAVNTWLEPAESIRNSVAYAGMIFEPN